MAACVADPDEGMGGDRATPRTWGERSGDDHQQRDRHTYEDAPPCKGSHLWVDFRVGASRVNQVNTQEETAHLKVRANSRCTCTLIDRSQCPSLICFYTRCLCCDLHPGALPLSLHAELTRLRPSRLRTHVRRAGFRVFVLDRLTYDWVGGSAARQPVGSVVQLPQRNTRRHGR